MKFITLDDLDTVVFESSLNLFPEQYPALVAYTDKIESLIKERILHFATMEHMAKKDIVRVIES
jgi:hypothetical protein